MPLTHPAPHPVVARAREAGCEVVGDIGLFADARGGAAVVGVTGTNGKSTTTALIGHLLDACGRPAAVGGNLGRPALELPALDRRGVYVLELSSFQIDLAPSLACDVAVLLNLSPDHLDRHGDMAGYAAVKKRLLLQQSAAATAIVGVDGRARRSRLRGSAVDAPAEGDPDRRRPGCLRAASMSSTGSCTTPRVPPPSAGIWPASTACSASTTGRTPPPPSPSCRRSACRWSRRCGRSPRSPACPTGSSRWRPSTASASVNDSKATNADAAARALATFENIHWIAGGIAKAGGIATLEPYFGRIAHAYLIGDAAAQFAATLGERVPHSACGDLPSALAAAFAGARAGPEGAVVLLSPACASFDQWADYEARGDDFRDRVDGLARDLADRKRVASC